MPETQPLWIGLIFIFGLCVGSFLNVMALRFLNDEPIVLPPSHCPHCNMRLRPIDNIPVLSYILLGGACHGCKKPISIQYPLVELATGLLFCATVWFFGLNWQSALLMFFIANLVVIFITDLRESLIFNFNSIYMIIPAGVLYSVLNLGHNAQPPLTLDLGTMVLHIPATITSALLAMGLAFAFFEGMIWLSMKVFGTEGFGHGDTYLMMGAGAFLGWPLMGLALMLGFLAQTIPAIPMLVYQWIQQKQYWSLGSGIASFMFGLGPMWLMNMPLDLQTRAFSSLFCIVGALISLFIFLRQVKSAQTFTYLPLGPALILGILVALFFGQDLMSGYQHYLASAHSY